MSPPPVISLAGAVVGYRDKIVLNELDFHVPARAFAALLGPNGAGKTTLLKTLAGIIPLLAGALTFAGTAPAIGYVPQREQLDPIYRLSSLDVVLMGSFQRVKPGRRIPAAIKDEARACLAATGSSDLAHRAFSELSGGQKQRVLTARALLANPDLLLLDEPTAGLDAASADALVQTLASIHKNQNLAILMVTHDLGAVRKYFHNAIWVGSGRLRQGPVAEMLQPALVARCLGLDEPGSLGQS